MIFVHGDLALGRISVACGPASMLLPVTETTTPEMPNTTDERDAYLPSTNVTYTSAKNNEEPSQLQHLGKIATSVKYTRNIKLTSK